MSLIFVLGFWKLGLGTEMAWVCQGVWNIVFPEIASAISPFSHATLPSRGECIISAFESVPTLWFFWAMKRGERDVLGLWEAWQLTLSLAGGNQLPCKKSNSLGTAMPWEAQPCHMERPQGRELKAPVDSPCWIPATSQHQLANYMRNADMVADPPIPVKLSQLTAYEQRRAMPAKTCSNNWIKQINVSVVLGYEIWR